VAVFGWETFVDLKVLTLNKGYVHGVMNSGTPNEWYITTVYGSPNSARIRSLCAELNEVPRDISRGWVVAGDFNGVLHQDERMTTSSDSNHIDLHFQRWFDQSGLIDIGFQGPKFTWNRGRSASRLDRILVNDTWYETYPDASVTHIPFSLIIILCC
jgi:hypothetical protein